MEFDTDEKKAFKQVPPGTYTGVCYLIADIGTQLDNYDPVNPKPVRQIMIGWELPDELTEDGKPMSVIKTYTRSLGEKATLAVHYKSWTKETNPTKFKSSELLGKGCNLVIGATSGGKAKVTGVSALKASETAPNLSRDPVIFDLDHPTDESLGRLPQFIKDKILLSPEYQKHVLGNIASAPLNDEIPY